MAKRIEGNEIINDSWAAKAVKQGEDLLKVLEKLEQQGKETADQLSKVAKSQSGATAKSIRDVTQAVSKSNAERKKSIAIDNEKKKLVEKLNTLNSTRVQKNEELKVQISAQRKANKQLARETTGLAGAYEKESKTLIKLRKQLKDLIITEGEGSKKTQQLKQRVTELDTKLKSADAAAGQFQRNVGNYPKAMGGAIASLKKFAGALGIVGGIQLLNRGLRNTFDIVKNFDQAQADLSSVLGVTREEMADLTAQAKELGATTQFTASQVSELQLEYAKLGFTQKEIQNVTDATLQLAAASGTDLANAASIVGSTLRGFGLDVTETQRLVDVMAKSFSTSSLDIDKFSSAMSNVAPAASAIGLTVEETTALLGSLTDAGIDASSAGTGLRNMFLSAKEQGITFDEALDQIANSSDKLGTSFDLFKKKGSTLGVILANNRDKTDELTQSLQDSSGAAEEMADKQLDTLGGSLKLLSSAWEGYILGADGAGGASESLKNIIKFLAENLKSILNAIVRGAVVFGSLKLAIKGVRIATSLYAFATKAAAFAQVSFSRGTKVASRAVKGFGLSLKSIPFVGIISGITTVVSLMWDMGDAAEEASEETSELDAAIDEINKRMIDERAELKGLFRDLQNTTAGTKERGDAVDAINDKYGTTLKNIQDEATFIRDSAEAYKLLNEEIKNNIRLEVTKEKRFALLKEQIQKEDRLIKMREQLVKDLASEKDVFIDSPMGGTTEQMEIFTAQASTMTQVLIDGLEADIANIDSLLKELDDLGLDEFGDGDGGGGGGTTSTTDPEAAKKKELDAFKKLQNNKLIVYENFLIEQGADKELRDIMMAEKELSLMGETGQKIIDLNFKNDDILNKHRNEFLKKAENSHADHLKVISDANKKTTFDDLKRFQEEENKKQKIREENEKRKAKEEEKANKKRVEDFKKTSKLIAESLQDITDIKQKDIDLEIEASKDQIKKSESEVERLQSIGTAQAIQSAEAEKRRIEKEGAEIEALEKKKRNLLIVTSGLARVNQLIQQGDGNPFQTTGKEMGDFFTNLASFYGGTETTIEDAMGRTGTKDGHVVRVHDNEHIVGAKDSDKLHSNGIYKTSDIVNSALNWKNLDSASLISARPNNNTHLIKEIQEMRNAFNSIDFPEQYVYLDRDVFKKNNSIKTVTHSNNRV